MWFDKLNKLRADDGALTIEELLALVDCGNVIHDPFSVIISRDVKIGNGNVLYPNVLLLRKNDGALTIGDDNVFWPGTIVVADVGSVSVGNSNQFGEGGCSIQANRPSAEVQVGNGGRYVHGVSIYGKSHLGDGSQVIGQISVDSCMLADGEGFRGFDPDKRGAVMKGSGTAKGLILGRGDVINAIGDFSDAPIERQVSYHQKKAIK